MMASKNKFFVVVEMHLLVDTYFDIEGQAFTANRLLRDVISVLISPGSTQIA